MEGVLSLWRFIVQDSELLEDIEILLRATKTAHLEAFRHTGGADPEWPDWYAMYLMDPLGRLFGLELTRDALSRLLVAAEEAQDTEAPGEDWVPFYARFLHRQLRAPTTTNQPAETGEHA
jgi:hypothetical protein